MSPKDKDQQSKTTSTSSLHQKLGMEKGEAPIIEEEGGEELSHKELRERLNEAEKKANESWDRMLRLQAEKTNMERIAKQDIEKAYNYTLEKFSSDLLPVIDSLERAIDAHANENDGVMDGVQLTLKMLQSACEKHGLKQVDPMGEAFNPEQHQAVSMQPDSGSKPGTVVTVLQKGYLLNNRLVRPAMVIVAK